MVFLFLLLHSLFSISLSSHSAARRRQSLASERFNFLGKSISGTILSFYQQSLAPLHPKSRVIPCNPSFYASTGANNTTSSCSPLTNHAASPTARPPYLLPSLPLCPLSFFRSESRLTKPGLLLSHLTYPTHSPPTLSLHADRPTSPQHTSPHLTSPHLT
ncbi:hypothetical protein B9Z19DRAFT_587419 [Tuber borchii]|uniref:Uncharacterized protein n=1 Tax=Tuber borchii TaxID=42251 RepID=A0A2T6ZC16_TUBBO|nr:hypothetical protein B9Z19DRAFT_587419 [Tuber borchii]